MTKKRTKQPPKTTRKAAPKAAPKVAATNTPQNASMAFAESFMKQWQTQWQDMLQKGGMPNMDMTQPQNGYIPLQQIGPMGLMAPMGAVALANLKLLQELQTRVQMLEAQLTPAPKPKKK